MPNLDPFSAQLVALVRALPDDAILAAADRKTALAASERARTGI